MPADRGRFGGVRTGEIALERNNGGVSVLTISGEHDLSTAPDFRSHIDELVGERRAIVVDLSPSTFVDSSILGVILDARRRAVDSGVGFAVCQDDGADAVARVLEITGLREELPVYPSLDAALDKAGSASGNGESS